MIVRFSAWWRRGRAERAENDPDPARQDRMLDLSGGDAAALAEITTAQDLIAAQDDADLIAMVRLAIHRDHLRNRNSNIPIRLPAVWALLEQPNRAESLAHSIPDHGRRAEALASIAEVALLADDFARGAALIAEAEALARRIADPQSQGHALMRVAEAAANSGDLDRAETIANSIADPDKRAQALGSVARAAAATGDPTALPGFSPPLRALTRAQPTLTHTGGY